MHTAVTYLTAHDACLKDAPSQLVVVGSSSTMLKRFCTDSCPEACQSVHAVQYGLIQGYAYFLVYGLSMMAAGLTSQTSTGSIECGWLPLALG